VLLFDQNRDLEEDMSIFGKRFSEYISFTRLFIVLILIVGITRLALSLAGIDTSIVKWISISAVLTVGLFYYPIKLHTTGFGTYKHLFPIVFIQSFLSQVIIVTAIAIAIFTGTDNVFSLPEYSGGVDGKNWIHAGSHAVLGITLAPIIAWAIGCLILFVTRKIAPKDKGRTATVNA
jgi:hypothetical protein